MKIIDHTVELLYDPTGIIEGDRYEFYLTIEVPEDDELFEEDGLLLRVLFAVTFDERKILDYSFIEKRTNTKLDFALEEEEEQLVLDYCVKHYNIADEAK